MKNLPAELIAKAKAAKTVQEPLKLANASGIELTETVANRFRRTISKNITDAWDNVLRADQNT